MELTSAVHDNFVEQIGWPELVESVATIYAALPTDQRARTAILAGNYGEAGAINLYGPAHGLPEAISGVNSYWARGYGEPPPQTLIVLGFRRDAAERAVRELLPRGRVANRYGDPERGDQGPPGHLPLPRSAQALARAVDRAPALWVSGRRISPQSRGAERPPSAAHPAYPSHDD